MSETQYKEYEYLTSCAVEHFFGLDAEKRPEYIKAILGSNALLVTFTKADGSTRDMLCTTDKTLIPKDKQFTPVDGDVPSTISPLVVVYDLGKKAIRSFRCDSVGDFDYVCPLEYAEIRIEVQS